MYPSINAWTFPDRTPPDKILTQAAQAGFAGVELVVAPDGPLRPDSPLEEFHRLAGQAADLGLRLVSLATGQFWQTNYASPTPEQRRAAVELTRQMLVRAQTLGAEAILVVPAVVGHWDSPRAQTAYSDALHLTLEALSELRHAAEAAGVTIAIENVWNRFLLSPVEFADVIDQVNSPHVAAYFDVGNIVALGYPEDWINTLGGRIARIHMKDYALSKPGMAGFCGLGEGDVDWPVVVGALAAAGYEGPLTYEGPGEPTDIRRRLERIIAGQNPL
jgi:hexulose-6-phosphate isomerase